ncbi:4-hydroxy-tetrahydrodipicolinate reductase [bacterium]|nr:4-hydroxy-tetrahydrodipicolinate reductase [bacterium]
MNRICVIGALGRMGSGIVKEIINDKAVELGAVIEIDSCGKIGQDIGECLGLGKVGVVLSDKLEKVVNDFDIIIDFTSPESTMKNLEFVVKNNKKIVIGTTGLNDEQKEKVKKAGDKIACLFSSNMSVGVNLLFKIVGEVAKALGEDYDIEIVEAHHRFKKDSPSGTALSLAESIAKALGRNLEKDAVYGRHGMVGERGRKEIGIHAVRAGDIVGEHTVIYGNLGERVEISHKAQSRQTFVMGAVRAAKFLVSRGKGFYTMQDVLAV